MLRPSVVRSLCLLLGAIAITGCGPSGPPPSAKVKGVVTHGEKPVTEGEIYFVAAEKGYSGNGTLNADGQYEITSGIPPANYRVFLAPPRITKPPMLGEAPPEAKPTTIDAKYQSESTSGLTAEIKPGENKFDFKLD
ncbi:MAG: hypothetical protein JSS49_11165 [Planctomycetes bacterium]|nr:hypothetical protein [Planctomycetota bacterium]